MSFESDKNVKNGKKALVLVVDDEANIRQAIRAVLRAEFDVTTVESGNKAIEKIRQGMDFDVVSLDLQMPGMSGIETLKEIKQHSPFTEVLLLTAHSDIESAKEALKLGAYDYIDKPFQKDELRASIRKGADRRSKRIASEKAQEQLAFVKAQLMQSEKFSAIGQLIAGVAHELNNPLTSIMGFSELLLRPECPPEKTEKYLKNINRSVFLCQKLVQKLLNFSRKYEPKRELVQINEIIENALDLKQYDFNVDKIEVVKQLPDYMPNTMADFLELEQVFLNIINNAHYAMKEHTGGGTLTVKNEFDDKVIRISFSDTGPGIPEENLQKVFEPLFTTKEKGKGTGLGLSVCYEIIQEHKGNIYVASQPGKGTCFAIEIPLVDGQPQSS